MAKAKSTVTSWKEQDKHLKKINRGPAPVVSDTAPGAPAAANTYVLRSGNRFHKIFTYSVLGILVTGMAAGASIFGYREITATDSCEAVDDSISQRDPKAPLFVVAKSSVAFASTASPAEGIENVFQYRLHTDGETHEDGDTCVLDVTVEVEVDENNFALSSLSGTAFTTANFRTLDVFNILEVKTDKNAEALSKDWRSMTDAINAQPEYFLGPDPAVLSGSVEIAFNDGRGNELRRPDSNG